jgi:hypothetical protein
MVTIAFEYTLHQKVWIKEIGIQGIICGLILEELGKQYRVVFWHEGIRKTEWLFSEEIETIKSTINT